MTRAGSSTRTIDEASKVVWNVIRHGSYNLIQSGAIRTPAARARARARETVLSYLFLNARADLFDLPDPHV